MAGTAVIDDPKLNPARIRALWVRAFSAWYYANFNTVPTYVNRHVPSWDGGESPQDGKRYTNIWPKIAAYCQAEDLDPEILIDALLSKSTKGKGRKPYPSQLTSDLARSVYDAVASSRMTEPRILLEQQGAILRAEKARRMKEGASESDAVRAALKDPFARFKVLFRHGSLVLCGDHEAALKYEDKAFMEYMKNPGGYDASWGKLIADSIRRRSDSWTGGDSGSVP